MYAYPDKTRGNPGNGNGGGPDVVAYSKTVEQDPQVTAVLTDRLGQCAPEHLAALQQAMTGPAGPVLEKVLPELGPAVREMAMASGGGAGDMGAAPPPTPGTKPPMSRTAGLRSI